MKTLRHMLRTSGKNSTLRANSRDKNHDNAYAVDIARPFSKYRLSHDQSRVAASKVRSTSGLYNLSQTHKTSNVMYTEVFLN